MDALTKAIQKAREDAGQGPTSKRRSLVPADIQYTKTRKVELYPGWLRRNRVIAADAQDETARAYKVLRTQVLQRMREHGWRTLGITSPGHGEGKTLTAINLAISLALEPNQTVLLVDADLGRPRIHSYLGIDAENGLREYLLDNLPVEGLLVHPRVRRLVILPGSGPHANSSEMLASPAMLQLVQELKRRYPARLVLFDLPPVLTTDDVVAFGPYLDAMLLVVEEGKTRRDELARAAQLVQASNQNLLGTVLNKSVEQATGYGLS